MRTMKETGKNTYDLESSDAVHQQFRYISLGGPKLGDPSHYEEDAETTMTICCERSHCLLVDSHS